jgi:import inner membrane translocase subunit TIM44
LHTTPGNLQAQKQSTAANGADPASSDEAASSQGQQQDTSKGSSGGSPDQDGNESSSDGKEKRQEGEKKQEQDKKEEPPPPPPHGNKTPWQVFTETLKTEFQASKEWNDSTKALASSAHQFTENESVKRARAAYEAASGAATSTTGSALRGTGRAIGKGAAWTWDTPVVKGVRAGVNMTGRAIEAGTRPVRETEVYKKAVGNVKDVIDDGSSSRYGGWIEKEERRKKREAREAREAFASGRPGKRVEKMEEDPK